MKKTVLYAAVSAITLFMFAACSTEKEFNKEFLYSGNGKWYCAQYPISGTTHRIYDIYKSDGTGKSWDIDDDMTEADALPFNWTLSGETLTRNDYTEEGVPVYSTYKVSELTATTFVYSGGGRTYSWTKSN